MGDKKKAPKQKPGSPAWMTTWADLVSLLMCFFVLLFSLSNVDEARFTAFAQAMQGNTFFLGALGAIFSDNSGMMPDQSPPVPLRQNPEAPVVEEPEDPDEIIGEIAGRIGQMEGMAEAFRTYMAPNEMAAELGIRVDRLGEYMAIDFPSGMLFASGSDVLLPEAVTMIDYVATWLARFPGHRIAVHGHTDNIPINTNMFRSNFHLSAGRAIAVVERLIYFHGFDPELLEPVGLGEFRPIDTNATVEGRANNRRVEIYVFAQQQSLTVITD